MSTQTPRNILKAIRLTVAEIGRLAGVTAGTALASKAVVLDSNADVTGARNITITGTLTAGTIASTGIGATQRARSTADVTKNASTTYGNVTGLTATVVPGTYSFRAVVPSTVASGTGGIKYAFNYTTAVLSSLVSSAKGYTSSAIAVQNTSSTTAQADLFTQAAVVILTEIEGTMVVTTGGTVDLQVAQNTSNGSNTVALTGATLTLSRIA